ncbi:MAG: flavodoxin [Thermoguttaceae bacterium]|nr:flavodoxin [Thermoguttaceae bacterium]
MEKTIAILMSLLAIVGFVGCSGGKTSDSAGATPGASSATSEASTDAAQTDSGQEGKKVLVVYFSATGTTKGVAEKIAALENAELYEIKAAQEYSTADLDWNDEKSRTTLEQKDKNVRPEIGSEPLSLEGYSKIYVGFPIWWGEEPRILDTFVESYNFDGITMIPFCTSGGSDVGRSDKNLAEHAGSGDWRQGQRFGGNVSDEKLKTWIDGLK